MTAKEFLDKEYPLIQNLSSIYGIDLRDLMEQYEKEKYYIGWYDCKNNIMSTDMSGECEHKRINDTLPLSSYCKDCGQEV